MLTMDGSSAGPGIGWTMFKPLDITEFLKTVDHTLASL